MGRDAAVTAMTAGQENSGSGGKGAGGGNLDGRLIPPQVSYWDIDLLTPDDVCALLKVKKSWLYDAVESGAIEAIRLGKQLRFRPSALVRYLDERASNGSAGHTGERGDVSPDSRSRG